MRLRNYQEDIVLHLIEIILENHPEIEADDVFIHDVAAYALNRIPPRYIMSERGFIRFAFHNLSSEGNGDGLTNLVEYLIVINKAIGVIQNRRRTPQFPFAKSRHEQAEGPLTPQDVDTILGDGSPSASDAAAALGISLEELVTEGGPDFYVHNFPQFIGRVVDQSSREPVYDTRVTLYINGEQAKPAEPSWLNPYYTNEPTKGYFSFWPMPLRSGTEKETFTITVSAEHDSYPPARIQKAVTIEGLHTIHNYIEGDAIVDLHTLYLESNSN